MLKLIPDEKGYINHDYEFGKKLTDTVAFKGIFIRYLADFALAV